MTTITTEMPHSLPKAEVATRLRNELDKRRGELEQKVSDLETHWSGDELAYSFAIYGFKVEGTLVVAEDSVKIMSNVPMTALMFKGQIQQTIQNEFDKLIS